MADQAARTLRTASLTFACLAGACGVAAAALLALGVGRGQTGLLLSGLAVVPGGLAWLVGALMFARLERSLLRVFTPAERAAAVPGTARVLGARRTTGRVNRRRIWRLRLLVTPDGGEPYEIERHAVINAATGGRLARGDLSLPCLIDPADPGRIQLVVRGAADT